MPVKDQRIILVLTLCWVVVSCIGGAFIGVNAAKVFIKPEKFIVTPINFYELAITQVTGGATYTPYPTFTAPPQSAPTQPRIEQPTPAFTPAAIPLPSMTPTQAAIFLVAFSWNVYPGDQAFIKVRIDPGVKCTIEVIDPLGKKVENPLLTAEMSNEYGICYWSWEMDEKSPTGVGTVTVRVNNLETTYLLQITKKD